MNRSPDISRSELAAEEQVTTADCRPGDRELAADRALRDELRALDTNAMPPALRTRVLNSTRRSHRPAWWLGLAAAIVMGVAAVLIIEPASRDQQTPTIADADLHELQLALAGLELGFRRAGTVTGQELAQTLSRTRIDLDAVPYANHFGRWIQPQTSSDN
jgi:hypothetical protein